jgi:ABC-type polar amino acid transport system ATPase subunit
MSTYSSFSKGSEWRKWDLHIHSNASDGTATPVEIIEEALAKGIDVIALTDHHTVKNIDEIKKLGSEKGIKVISGIEFRTEYGSRSVHMIGLFPDSYNGTKFKSNVLYEQILCPLELSETEIKSKGKEKESLDNDESAFKNGMFMVRVDFKKAADLIHKYGGLVSVHAGSKSNTVEEMKHQGSAPKKVKELYDSLGTVKEELLRNYIDICEIRKENDNESFYFERFGLPSIIASDAHNKSEIGTKYVWIKADPSFEGLKQILCEPEGRVKIQETNPNIKKSYNIIEKVSFIDNSGSAKFAKHEIGFNPDLNAIIGGKSSGKSLLLHSISKAVGNNTDMKDYKKILDGVELEVYYSDEPDKKRTPEDKRIIEFLPQRFIEQIVRGKSENAKDQNSQSYFDKFVEDLIRQDSEIGKLYEIHNTIVLEAQSKLDDSIKTWIIEDKALSIARQELKPLGDKKVILKEIDRLQKNLEDLTRKAGLTSDEFALFNKLSDVNNICNSRIEIFIQKKLQMENLQEYLKAKVIDDILNALSFISTDNYVESLFNSFKSKIYNVAILEKNNFENVLNRKIEKTSRIISILQNRIKKNNDVLSPILTKNQIQNEIKILENNISSEKEKIVLIENKEKEISEITKRRNGTVFIDFYRNILDSYNVLANKINEKIGLKWIEGQTNLDLAATNIFKSEKFINAIASVINTRKYLENQFIDCGFKESDYQYADNHIDNIGKILTYCIQDKKRFDNFISSGDTGKLLKALFSDCNYIDFDIRKGEDSLQDMSEGKMGIVILQLYLSLSKSDCPILIDQPEDNLDNRTVYVELNDYIKQCKQRRQIIMVSHNANLVVNTDAENVIVANQAGEDGKDNKDHKFEYVNGALENTFTELDEKGVLYQKGIREHVCEILEGGTDAFKKREEKYNLK